MIVHIQIKSKLAPNLNAFCCKGRCRKASAPAFFSPYQPHFKFQSQTHDQVESSVVQRKYFMHFSGKQQFVGLPKGEGESSWSQLVGLIGFWFVSSLGFECFRFLCWLMLGSHLVIYIYWNCCFCPRMHAMSPVWTVIWVIMLLNRWNEWFCPEANWRVKTQICDVILMYSVEPLCWQRMEGWLCKFRNDPLVFCESRPEFCHSDLFYLLQFILSRVVHQYNKFRLRAKANLPMFPAKEVVYFTRAPIASYFRAEFHLHCPLSYTE